MTYKIDYLTLVSGVDIPIPELMLTVRQPKIREIAMLGEDNFYKNCSFLLVTKEKMLNQLSTKYSLAELEETYKDYSDYNILYTLFTNEDDVHMGALQIMDLVFPGYCVLFDENSVLFSKKDTEPLILRQEQFQTLNDVLKTVLCLNPGDQGEEEFNPGNDKAREIAEKLKARKQKLKELKGETEKTKSIIGNYVSSLAIGTNSYTIEMIKDLTLFQLYDQVKRYGLHSQNDLNIRAQLAGAKDVEHVDWLGELK